jgi:hypothetical protein
MSTRPYYAVREKWTNCRFHSSAESQLPHDVDIARNGARFANPSSVSRTAACAISTGEYHWLLPRRGRLARKEN